MSQTIEYHNSIPIIPIREGVIFPHTEVLLTFEHSRFIEAIEKAVTRDRLVIFVMQKSKSYSEPGPNDLYRYGCLAEVQRVFKNSDGANILARGIQRAKVISFNVLNPYFLGNIVTVKEKVEPSYEVEALQKHLSNELRKAVNLGKPIDYMTLMNIISPSIGSGEFSFKLASTLDLKPKEKQELIEINSSEERLLKLNDYLSKEIQILEIEKDIASQTQQKITKSAREALLREKLETIEKELGEKSGDYENTDLQKRIKSAGMPVNIRQKAEKEFKKITKMSPLNPEISYIKTYLDWLVSLPWKKLTEAKVDLREAEKILNQDHYGLEKIKERIIEYLAVIRLKTKKNNYFNVSSANILCFVGPPGVGKTSIGKSIAKALNRKFISISLGGIRDEAEIRGHRRTYVGAQPGKIIQSIKAVDTRNPVFMMDEIDKITTSDFMGNPSAALLEVLDPNQNHNFQDHYLEVPFDLSQVFFITTANLLETIPPPLRDRLEIITFSGYTEDEKFNIVKYYLLHQELSANGLDDSQVNITDRAFVEIIRRYTKEAGVRNLSRELSKILRKVARKIVENETDCVTIDLKDLEKYLGPTKFKSLIAKRAEKAGVSPALAWTEAGGDVLSIEVALMPGKGNLSLTGQLGEIMKESCMAALSYIRSNTKKYGLNDNFYKNLDVHVHVPEGSVPKDGPSAGVAIVTAMLSALTNIPVKKEIGMTGEITLRGNVLEVGGIKEKVIAAHRNGLTKIILPADNNKDLMEIPTKVRNELNFVFVDTLQNVFIESMKVSPIKRNV